MSFCDFSHIESVVCDCVNDVVGKSEVGMATPFLLYVGNTRVYLRVSIARQFCYYILHDIYHQSYSVIAKHVGRSARNVIGGAGKCRSLITVDDIYLAVDTQIKQRLGLQM